MRFSRDSDRTRNGRTKRRPRFLAATIFAFLSLAASVEIARDFDRMMLFDIAARALDHGHLKFEFEAHLQIGFAPRDRLRGSNDHLPHRTGRRKLKSRLLRLARRAFITGSLRIRLDASPKYARGREDSASLRSRPAPRTDPGERHYRTGLLGSVRLPHPVYHRPSATGLPARPAAPSSAGGLGIASSPSRGIDTYAAHQPCRACSP